MARRKKYHRQHKGLDRRVNARKEYDRFLIVCEGKQTERNYFEDLRIRGRISGKVKGIGENTVRVVEHALKVRKEENYDRPKDQVWCVFDRDVFPEENFNAALRLAEKHGIKVAYSNEAFELWYVLHFNYHESATARHLYVEKLTKLLGVPYEKNRLDMYERLEDRQETAIRNAENLLDTYQPHRPAHDNPCTTVHLLVQELNRFAV